ncbi:MAG: hypothetical protein CME70_04310 [Halobacteriovorax sp.]|nr:hypothetical protein [Halobacteriovorax sp.]|tara:strand:- start:49126 stop:49545 length:420 start_codon:yes stop_codon:yes gene_type:complete
MIKLFAISIFLFSTITFASEEAIKQVKKLEVEISKIEKDSHSCKKLESKEQVPCHKKKDRALSKAQYKKLAISKCLKTKKDQVKCLKKIDAKTDDCLFLKKGNIVCKNGNRFLTVNDGKKVDEPSSTTENSSNQNTNKK